jgi:UDP-3-O-[3-hydroxymyristoyl] glucosamine N-acyltransferase
MPVLVRSTGRPNDLGPGRQAKISINVGDLVDAFPKLLSILRGGVETPIGLPCPATQPQAGCILFLHDRRLIAEAVSSPAAVLVVNNTDIGEPVLAGARQAVLQSLSPELAMALVCQTFFPVTAAQQKFDGYRIHPSAVISQSAQIAEDVVIGPNAVIGAEVRIGSASIIGANTQLERDVVIGAHTHIRGHVFVAHSTRIGGRCEIHPMSSLGTEGFGYAHDENFNHYRHVHYGRLIIEDDVHIGAGVLIDSGRFEDSLIGHGTKIDNYCHFGHNIKIGRNCLFAGGIVVGGSVTIGDNNVFGGRTTISDHITIGNNMRFAGLSGISKSVDEPGSGFGGYPLQPAHEFLKAVACIAHLPRMRRNVDQIMRKLGSR